MKKRILHIDDKPENKKDIGNLLEQEGYEFTSFSDGLEALREVKEGLLYDAVILDRSMKPSGEKIAKELRILHPSKLIIMLAAIPDYLAESGDIMHLNKLGIDKYFCKPIESSHLLNYLKARLNN